MATGTREPNLHSAKKVPLFPLLSLLCFTSIFLLLSQFKNTSFAPSTSHSPSLHTFQIQPSCDYSDGTWIHDEARTPRYDNTCKEIFKGWNCISGNKSNARELATWRWKPRRCDLPQFDPVAFLNIYRDTSIGTRLLSLRRDLGVILFSILGKSCVLFGIVNSGCSSDLDSRNKVVRFWNC